MCGKSASQILRVAMFIHAFKIAFQILDKIAATPELNVDVNILNSRLELAIGAIAKVQKEFNVISQETLVKAENLVSYFNKNKLCFAEYDVDFNLDFLQILSKLDKNIVIPSIIPIYTVPMLRELSKKIIFFPTGDSLTFKINDLNQSISNKYKKEDIVRVAKELESQGFGSIYEEKLNGVLRKVI